MDYQQEVLGLLRDFFAKNRQPVQMISSGNSMSPLIRKGELLTVSPCGFKDINPGEIAVFDAGNNIACAHRLMAKFAKNGLNWLITKPDVCFAVDNPVKESFLLGKVVAVKKNKYLIKFDQFPWFLINLALAAVHLCAFYLKKKLRPARISIGTIS